VCGILFVFLAGILLALIDCVYIGISRISNLVVLGTFGSFYCVSVLTLFMSNLAYGPQELQKTYLFT